MKKTVLVLGCLLAIGFSSVSCNRDDIPDTGPFTESKVVETEIQRSDLPKKVDHYLSAVLGENMYDATFTNKNVPNPYSGTQVYSGVAAKKVTKQAQDGAVILYQVVLSNGAILGFDRSGDWAYLSGYKKEVKEVENGKEITKKVDVPLPRSAWDMSLPSAVQASVVTISSTAINEIMKIEIENTSKHGIVYTITLKNGTVKKYKKDGTVVP
ncbi:MAG: hypothetical protein ACFN00_01395 [Flavobacteriaceae bacterium]